MKIGIIDHNHIHISVTDQVHEKRPFAEVSEVSVTLLKSCQIVIVDDITMELADLLVHVGCECVIFNKCKNECALDTYISLYGFGYFPHQLNNEYYFHWVLYHSHDHVHVSRLIAAFTELIEQYASNHLIRHKMIYFLDHVPLHKYSQQLEHIHMPIHRLVWLRVALDF